MRKGLALIFALAILSPGCYYDSTKVAMLVPKDTLQPKAEMQKYRQPKEVGGLAAALSVPVEPIIVGFETIQVGFKTIPGAVVAIRSNQIKYKAVHRQWRLFRKHPETVMISLENAGPTQLGGKQVFKVYQGPETGATNTTIYTSIPPQEKEPAEEPGQ